MEASALNVGEKPQRSVPGRTHTVRLGLKPNPLSAPWGIQTGVLEIEGEERYHLSNHDIPSHICRILQQTPHMI